MQILLLEMRGSLAAIDAKIDALTSPLDDMKDHLDRQHVRIDTAERCTSDIEDDTNQQTKLQKDMKSELENMG